MWLFFAPAPRPDARYWPGRRMAALIDAVAWPMALAASIVQLPFQTGAFGQVLSAVCCIQAARRAWRAGLANHRYRFTTACFVGPFTLLLVVAAMLKLAA